MPMKVMAASARNRGSPPNTMKKIRIAIRMMLLRNLTQNIYLPPYRLLR